MREAGRKPVVDSRLVPETQSAHFVAFVGNERLLSFLPFTICLEERSGGALAGSLPGNPGLNVLTFGHGGNVEGSVSKR